MIIESILTTVNERGAANFAPMGVEWEEDEIVIKPFLETTTFKNLEATRAAVVNLTDDVMLFARGAISDVQFPARAAAVVRGEPAREREHPRRVGSLGREARGRAGFEQERRCGDSGSDAAEAATQVAPQVEHAEMEPRGRLDEQGRLARHRAADCSGRVRRT